MSLTLGNQGSEVDWPYQGSIEAAKVRSSEELFHSFCNAFTPLEFRSQHGAEECE